MIERAGGWAQNYPALVYSGTQILWHLQRTDELETLERSVRTKVVEPDVRYPEASGRVALAQLCALAGRTDEARHWFDEARRVHEEQGNEPLLVAADFDEALMNHRLGTADSYARARVLLERARARATHPALAAWVARIDDLSARLA